MQGGEAEYTILIVLTITGVLIEIVIQGEGHRERERKRDETNLSELFSSTLITVETLVALKPLSAPQLAIAYILSLA